MAKASTQSATAPAAVRPERGRLEREDLVFRVEYRIGDRLLSDFARNISEGGLFIATESALPVSTVISLEFRLPGNQEPIVVNGRVVWTVNGGPEQPSGMGIEFENLDDSALRRIRQLMRKLGIDTPSESR
jgi:type IV pilus assembly protein PilZ